MELAAIQLYCLIIQQAEIALSNLGIKINDNNLNAI